MTMQLFSLLATALLLTGCQAADAVGEGAGAASSSDSTTTAAANETTTTTHGEPDGSAIVQTSGERITPVPQDQLPQTEAAWKEALTAEQFYVLRKHGTERANSGEYADSKTKGTYHCAGCGEPLFDSETKFDSGTGWPSFYDVIGEPGDHIETQIDRSLFSTRTEVHCQRCDGHLGHVFEDGPAPTGLRYCMNSAALKLDSHPYESPAKKTPPADGQ